MKYQEGLTETEKIFIEFLNEKNIPFERIKEGKEKVPDFQITWNPPCWIEIKDHSVEQKEPFIRLYGKKGELRTETYQSPESRLRYLIKNELSEINEKFNKYEGTKVLWIYSDCGLYERKMHMKIERNIYNNDSHCVLPSMNKWTWNQDIVEFFISCKNSKIDLILILSNSNNIIDGLPTKWIDVNSSKKILDRNLKTFFKKIFNIDDIVIEKFDYNMDLKFKIEDL